MKKNFLPLICLFLLTLLFSNKLQSQTWEEQAVGELLTGYGVFDVSVVDENTVWAVAFNQNTGSTIPAGHITFVLKTTDGGDTWEKFPVEEAQGRISFDIEAFDENVAFITTQDFNNGSGRGVFKTTDGGENWEEKFNDVAAGVWIRFFNDQEGVIINRSRMATTQDGGETWELVASANIPAYQNNEFTIISSGNNSCQLVGDHVWFGTNKGRVYRSKDKGHSWEAFDAVLGANALILSVAFRDTLNGLAVNVNTPTTSFSQTSDGGETWHTISSSPPTYIANIAFVPGTDGTFIGTSDRNHDTNDYMSAYSTDFGETWEIIGTGVPHGGTLFLTPETGWTSRGLITDSGQPAMYKWEGDIFVDLAESFSDKTYNIFPNPFHNYVTVTGSGLISEYQLYTNSGQLIQSGRLMSNMAPLKLGSLQPGMYTLKLTFENGTSVARRIIKAN